MNYKETGFRALYHSFCAFPLTKQYKDCMSSYPCIDKANCMLVYGYIDTEAGLTLEVLSAGRKSKEGFRFFDAPSNTRFFFRIGAVSDTDFTYFGDEPVLQKRYANQINALHTYDADEEVEKSRQMVFLDESRNSGHPDDVLVYLMREGYKPEGCWTRICGLGKRWIMGTLLNEPDQPFGYHEGERIAFFVQKTDDSKVICYADMTPSRKLTVEDLEDGSILKTAVTHFNQERTQDNFLEILELLRDSYVWVACNAILSERDMADIKAAIDAAGDDVSSMIGQTLSNQDNIRMVPDILQNGDDFFFPVFSSCEEMGDYGNGFSKIQRHFLDALNLAMNNDKHVRGVVLNAFSEPFVLDREVWDIVPKMKSRLLDNEDADTDDEEEDEIDDEEGNGSPSDSDTFLQLYAEIKTTLTLWQKMHPETDASGFIEGVIRELDTFANGGAIEEDYCFSFDIRTEEGLHYISVEFEPEIIQVTDGGSVYTEGVGSDSYTNWIYSIWRNGYDKASEYSSMDLSTLVSIVKEGATLSVESPDKWADLLCSEETDYDD